MKTHDVAKSLNMLAKLLKAAPNQELEDIKSIAAPSSKQDSARIVVSLSMLAQLSTYGKSEWAAVIEEYKLPISIRPRDAARDVLGKLLTYLEENATERERVTREAQQNTKSSSELNSALKFLLRNG